MILNEVTFVETEQLNKSVEISNDGIMTIRNVILSKTEEKNKNNRVYPKAIFERELNKLMPRINSRALRGELDHPEERLDVLLREGSHLITKAFWDPTMPTWIRGDIEILKTPLGGLIEVYIKQKSPVGISSRGEGSLLMKDDYYEVQSDFNLRTYDIVSDQSTAGAIISMLESTLIAERNKNKTFNAEQILETYYKEFSKNQDLLYNQILKTLKHE